MNVAPNHEPPTVDQRLTGLELRVEHLIERVASLETVVVTKRDLQLALDAATNSQKAEFHATITSLIKWIAGIMFVGGATGIAAVTFVLTSAVGRITAEQQPASPTASAPAPAKPR